MIRQLRLAVIVCSLVSGSVVHAAAPGTTLTHTPQPLPARALPLTFEPVADAPGNGPQAFVARDGRATIVTQGARTHIVFADDRSPASSSVRITLHDTEPDAAPRGENRLPGHTNYVIGPDPFTWRFAVPHYARVRTPDIYQGIDLLFHVSAGEIEFDFVVRPGADPSRISWRHEVEGDVRQTAGGDLVITSSGHTVTCRKPVAYQWHNGTRRDVGAAFELRGPAGAESAVVGFRLDPYDPSLPLVIDPVLTFATYLGGPDQDVIYAVASRSDGTDYIAGTMNRVQTTGGTEFYFDGRSDGFVARLNAAGSAFDYLTIFGGGREDEGRDLVVGPGGRVWVAGLTRSADFPTVDPLFAVQAGQSCTTIVGVSQPCSDAILMELDGSGAITWSTPIGGRYNDSAIGIAFDGSSGLYLTGSTDSPDFPGGGAPRSKWGDAWVARVDATARSVTYIFRLPAYTRTQAIAVDAAGAAHVTGYVVDTTSDLSRFTATPGAFQGTYAGDTCSYFRGIISGQCGDAFVVRLSVDGSSIDYATFLGGKNDDVATDLDVDERGSVTVGGWTRSKDFPTARAIQPANRSGPSTDPANDEWGRDAFVARLGPDGAVLEVSTYLGGVGDDGALALMRNADGSLIVAGLAGSLDFPGDALPGVPAPGVLFVSTRGNEWAGTGLGLPVAPVSLCPHPGRPGTLYAVARGTSAAPVDLLRSRDAGHAWQSITPALPSDLSIYSGAEVFLDPARPAVVFARFGGLVYRSGDEGDTWTTVQGPMPGAAFDFFVALGSISYARSVPTGAPPGVLSRSEDDGATWTALDPTPGAGARIVGTAFRPAIVHAPSPTGLFRSVDAGRSFTLVDNTLSAWPARTLLVNPSNPNVLYAADGTAANEPLRSGDGGSTWQPFREGLPAGAAHLLSIDQQPPHTIYALASNQRVFGRAEGASWVEEPSPGPTTSAMARVVIGNGPARVYAVVAPYAAKGSWFVARLTGDDTHLDYATRVAPANGASSTQAGALGVNDEGSITLAGSSTSSALQTTPGAVQPAHGGSIDGILLRLAPWSSTADGDGDGLPDAWAVATGLAASSARAPDADPDHDGLTNSQEAAAGSHPLGFVRRYLAEGSTGPLFDTEVAVANLSSTETAHVLLRWQRSDGVEATTPLEVPPRSRRAVDPEGVPGFENAAFSTLVESDVEVLVDRRMRWDASGYGSHLEQASLEPATTWYFAKGATHSGFDLFYLVQNPGDAAAAVRVTYLRPAPQPPLERIHVVPAHGRYTIWVDAEGSDLASTDVSAIVRSDMPVVVERAMYLSGAGRLFAAGHASAGVTAPGLHWYFAEGATGTFFDTFLLVANPDERAAEISVYFRTVNSAITRQYTVAPRSRLTIWVDQQDPQLADSAFSAMIYVTNAVPVVAERAMWWPGPTADTWTEAHGVSGSPEVSAVWGFADGEVGGPNNAETYILVNDQIPGYAFTVTLLFEDGTTAQRTYTSTARFNVPVGLEFPEARGRRFAAVVVRPYRKFTSSPEAPWGSGLVVERAVYSDADGVFWAAGSAALATNLARHLVFLDARTQNDTETAVPLGSSVWFVDASSTPVTVGPDNSASVPGCAEVAAVGPLEPGVPRVSAQFRERKTCAWVADSAPQFPGFRRTGRIVVR